MQVLVISIKTCYFDQVSIKMERYSLLQEHVQCSLDDFFLRCKISSITAHHVPEEKSKCCIKDDQQKSQMHLHELPIPQHQYPVNQEKSLGNQDKSPRHQDMSLGHQIKSPSHQFKSTRHHQNHPLQSLTHEPEVQHQKHSDHPLPGMPLLQPPKDMPHCLLSIDNKHRNAVFTLNDEEAMKLSSELNGQLCTVFLMNVGLS